MAGKRNLPFLRVRFRFEPATHHHGEKSEPIQVARRFSILDRDMRRRLWPSLLTGAFALSAALISIYPSAGFVDLPPTTRARSFVEGTQNVVCFTAAMKDEAPEKVIMDQHESGRIKGSKKTAASVDDPMTEIPKATKKGKKAASKKRKKDVAPKHWLLETDDFIFHGKSSPEIISDSSNVLLRFTVRGNPLPLRRHRTSRGFVYNPSAPAQASFRQIVQSVVFPDHNPDDNNELEPVFSEGYTLAMTIVFRTKRPMHHFIGSKPAAGRLKESAPTQTAPTRSDVDNLAKFVLDSLNGLLYHDDKQISSLHVTKLLDNEDDCRGSTEVCLRVLADDKVSTLLNNTFQLF
jgi:Holliday junction resolvase RusA-like endonuclease